MTRVVKNSLLSHTDLFKFKCSFKRKQKLATPPPPPNLHLTEAHSIQYDQRPSVIKVISSPAGLLKEGLNIVLKKINILVFPLKLYI